MINFIQLFFCSLVPYREQSTLQEAEKEANLIPRKPYSPFQPTTKTDFALARVDDLINWARKVHHFI